MVEMKKEDFENKIVELVKEYSGADIKLFAIQSLDISIGVNTVPKISFNGYMVKE
uniref:Uncharacterized protein n=1 Tax=viral metagenome TaxID=1070528 RepID=A0A6M3XXZ6_9ZZZZ